MHKTAVIFNNALAVFYFVFYQALKYIKNSKKGFSCISINRKQSEYT